MSTIRPQSPSNPNIPTKEKRQHHTHREWTCAEAAEEEAPWTQACRAPARPWRCAGVNCSCARVVTKLKPWPVWFCAGTSFAWVAVSWKGFWVLSKVWEEELRPVWIFVLRLVWGRLRLRQEDNLWESSGEVSYYRHWPMTVSYKFLWPSRIFCTTTAGLPPTASFVSQKLDFLNFIFLNYWKWPKMLLQFKKYYRNVYSIFVFLFMVFWILRFLSFWRNFLYWYGI